MELKELSCKRCGAPISREDLNTDLGLATCAHCGTIFSVASSSAGTFQPTSLLKREPVPIPERFDVVRASEGLQISYRWFGLSIIIMAVFAVFWNGFMLVWHGISLASGAWFMSLFGLLHTAVGIGLGYYVLAGFLNRTTIWVEPNRLLVRHHPLPWFGNQDLNAAEVDQLYSKKVIKQTKNGPRTSYEVHAIVKEGKKQKLLGRLKEPEQAIYIEQEIESYLGLRDKMVPGELPRS